MTMTSIRRGTTTALAGGLTLLLSVGTAAEALPVAAAPATASAVATVAPVVEDDPTGTITVMGRNLYLGADVGVALELLPDMPAAAQFMWDQVAATDFDTRVKLLAQEAAATEPDVIGLQEATIWSCRPKPWSSAVPVFDFTTQFLAATAAAGVTYQVAQGGEGRAENPGYAIPPIPLLTRVEDPETFGPLFGTDSADCGFFIGDALLVRDDLADDVQAAGTGEYGDRYAIAPVVFEIDRGYAWADLAVAGTTVRVVTTHLESLWAADSEVTAAQQARQLVADLEGTTAPTIVIGDFNSDPRDPRPVGSSNPGGQPEAGTVCAAQPDPVTAASADPSCSAYWTMIAGGFADAGPDSLDARNWTWGADGDLAGPSPQRLAVALQEGNDAGFTDRLDYVFVRNGAQALSAEVFGNRWPDAQQVWQCSDPSQIATTEQSSTLLAEAGLAQPITGRGVCLPTDHAGLLAVVDVSAGPAGVVAQPAPDARSSVRIGLLGWLLIIVGVLLLVVVLLLWGIYRLITRGRRRRRREAAAAGAGEPTG
ncbi:MAG: endonuclease/exonuclease/phosphatase family protein [Candidatus Nanopelagicales bacterium]